MQNTKALIQSYYDSFNRQDMDIFFSLLDEEVIHDINQNGCEVGKSAFINFMQRMNHSYKETVKDLKVMVNEDGTHAAAEFMIEGTYLTTDHGLPEAKGQHYQLACGAFFQVKNGKIVHVTNYYNLQDWLKQIQGLNMAKELKIISLKGSDIIPYISELAKLRIEIFSGYPYLYWGDLEYEAAYLQTYVKCSESIMVLVFDEDRVVGASTAIPLEYETAEIQKPFLEHNINLQEVFYLGESVLLPAYRGQNIYRHFFHERESAAKAYGAKIAAFAAVERSLEDPRRPLNYIPLDNVWKHFGYEKHPELFAWLEWKEMSEEISPKQLTFWLKTLNNV